MAKAVGVYERPRKRALPRLAVIALVAVAAAAAGSLVAYLL